MSLTVVAADGWPWGNRSTTHRVRTYTSAAQLVLYLVLCKSKTKITLKNIIHIHWWFYSVALHSIRLPLDVVSNWSLLFVSLVWHFKEILLNLTPAFHQMILMSALFHQGQIFSVSFASFQKIYLRVQLSHTLRSAGASEKTKGQQDQERDSCTFFVWKLLHINSVVRVQTMLHWTAWICDDWPLTGRNWETDKPCIDWSEHLESVLNKVSIDWYIKEILFFSDILLFCRYWLHRSKINRRVKYTFNLWWIFFRKALWFGLKKNR